MNLFAHSMYQALCILVSNVLSKKQKRIRSALKSDHSKQIFLSRPHIHLKHFSTDVKQLKVSTVAAAAAAATSIKKRQG